MTDEPIRPQSEHLITDLEALKVYFDPVRQRILRELVGEPRSIHDLATVLDVPFTRLYYQIHLLEKHGFIRVVETRPLAGAVEEKFYQVTAYSFPIHRSLLTLATPEGEQGMEYVMNVVLDETRADLRTALRSGLINMEEYPPHPDALLFRRTPLYLTREQAQAFFERLLDLEKEMFAAQQIPGADKRSYNFIVGFHLSSVTADDQPASDAEAQ
jgi:DNA-binding transcriptional ArsR family regulator